MSMVRERSFGSGRRFFNVRLARPPMGFLLLAAVFMGASSATAQQAATTSPAPLARYIPRQDLAAYLEVDGIDAHAAGWKKTALSKILDETTLGALIEDLAKQAIDVSQRSTPPDRQVQSDVYLAYAKQVVKNGVAIGVLNKAGPPASAPGVVFVIRDGNRPETMQLLETAKASRDAKPIEVKGRTVHELQGGSVWWLEKNDLVWTSKAAMEPVLAVIDGAQPSAVDHPLRAPLAQKGADIEPVAIGFLDMAALPAFPPDAIRLGLSDVKKIEMQWGFQNEALLTRVRVDTPSPRHGILAMFDQPALDLKALPLVPAGQTAFAAISIDLGKFYDQYVTMYKESRPQDAQAVEMTENAIRQQFNVDLRNDLLAHLGPRISIYSHDAGVAIDNPAVGLIAAATGMTLTVEVRDQAAFAKNLETLVDSINQLMNQMPGPGGDTPRLRKLDGAAVRYVLELPDGALPEPFTSLQLTIGLGKNELIVSGTAEGADKAIAASNGTAEARWSPSEAQRPVVAHLPQNPIMLVMTDPRDTLPPLIENLPKIIDAFNAQFPMQVQRGVPPLPFQVDPDKLPSAEKLRALLFPASAGISVDAKGILLEQREPVPSFTSPGSAGFLAGLMLPAVQSAREAARRSQCVNNLKQILLAIHNFISATNLFPRDYTDKDGKPILSWRVALLPYLEQQELYNKFHLDEPWDSEHNKELIKEMPKLFACPDREGGEPFTTTYRGFNGPRAMFETGLDFGFQHITDGTSNTIAVVEAQDAVPWTKPDDLPFDEAADPSLYGAGSPHPGGFNVGFADGSVRFIRNTINAIVFKALITKDGGEVINADAF